MDKFFDRFKKKQSPAPAPVLAHVPSPSTYPGGVEPSAPPAPPGMFSTHAPAPPPSTPAVPVGKITLIGGNTGSQKGGKRKTKRYRKKNKSRKIKTKKTKRRNRLYK